MEAGFHCSPVSAKSAPVAFLVGADLRGLVRDERDWKEGKEAMKVANLEGAKIEVNPTKQNANRWIFSVSESQSDRCVVLAVSVTPQIFSTHPCRVDLASRHPALAGLLLFFLALPHGLLAASRCSQRSSVMPGWQFCNRLQIQGVSRPSQEAWHRV
eukprot:2557289-Rhodomonas_salina.1